MDVYGTILFWVDTASRTRSIPAMKYSVKRFCLSFYVRSPNSSAPYHQTALQSSHHFFPFPPFVGPTLRASAKRSSRLPISFFFFPPLLGAAAAAPPFTFAAISAAMASAPGNTKWESGRRNRDMVRNSAGAGGERGEDRRAKGEGRSNKWTTPSQETTDSIIFTPRQ